MTFVNFRKSFPVEQKPEALVCLYHGHLASHFSSMKQATPFSDFAYSMVCLSVVYCGTYTAGFLEDLLNLQ